MGLRNVDWRSTARVTVIVGSYNHAAFLRQAIAGLESQTFRDFNVVIFDDASSDDSPRLILELLTTCSFPAVFHRHVENIGLCASLNEALRFTRSEFVVVISADDWIESTRLEDQVAALDAAGDASALCYSNARNVDREGLQLAGNFIEDRIGSDAPPSGWVLPDLLRINFMPTLATMIRRSAIEAVGNFDESMLSEDYDLWLRLASKYQFLYLDKFLANYRLLDHSLTTVVFSENRDRSRAEQIRSLKKILNLSRETDKQVLNRIRELSVWRYLDSATPREVLADFTLVARYRHDLKSLAYLMCARIGVPGRRIAQLRRPSTFVRSRR